MITAQDAVIVGDAELERGTRAAFAVCVITGIVALVVALHWLIGGAPWGGLAFGGVVGVGASISVALVVQSHFKGQGQVDKVIAYNHKVYAPKTPMIIDGESTPSALPEPTPTLPTPTLEDETFRYMHNGVGEDVPKKLLHGFDPRGLLWLCEYLERGGKWTEDKLEKVALPYHSEPLGKADGDTPYQRLFSPEQGNEGLLIRAAIIVERGPKKAGRLAVLEAVEMMQRIRALAA